MINHTRKTNYLFLFVLLSAFISCQKDKEAVDMLIKAQQEVEQNPEQAFIILDSIPDPQSMGEDYYMQYIVARVQAKYKTYRNVTQDTLVLQAQRYFEGKNDTKNGASSCFYSGALYLERKDIVNAMKYFLLAKHTAILSKNDLMTARSQQNIGDLFYLQNMNDSSIVSYKQALNLHNNVKNDKNVDIYKLQTVDLIGRSYYKLENLDSALVYYRKGLELAQEVENAPYTATFTQNVGFVMRDKGMYDEASSYLHSALSLTKSQEDSIRSYSNLAILFNRTNQLDSAGYYISVIKERLNKVTTKHLIRGIYAILSDYNRKTGDAEEAYFYSELYAKTDREILQGINAVQLIEAQNNYNQSLRSEQIRDQHTRYRLYLIIMLLAILLVVSAAYYQYKRRKTHTKLLKSLNKLVLVQNEIYQTQNELLTTKNDSLQQELKSIRFLQNLYCAMLTKWGEIEQEVKEIIARYEGAQKPAFYLKIESLITEIKRDTKSQLEEWAKNYLAKLPLTNEIINKLKSDELLLLAFSGNGYTNEEIGTLLDIPSQKVYPYKLKLKHRLKELGMEESETEKLVFGSER